MILVGVMLLSLSYLSFAPLGFPMLTFPLEQEASLTWKEELGSEALAISLSNLSKLDLSQAREVVQIVERECLNYGINPFRVLAFILAESAGNPRARSWAGAKGLMQIMPATGRFIASERGEKWRGSNSLYAVETSITYGVWYYQHLLGMFEGKENIAMAAYNWGPDHIRKRLRKAHRLPKVYPGKVFEAQRKLEEEFSFIATSLFWEGLKKNHPGTRE